MVVSRPAKQYEYELFRRKSLLRSFASKKHRLKEHLYSGEKLHRRSRRSSLLKNVYRTYQALHSAVFFVVQLFIFLEQLTRRISHFISQICQIIRVVHGWIRLIHAVISALHLITSRLMLISAALHRIFHLLSVLLEPFSNRSIEKFGHAFSHCLFDYYSSNGACYTLKARTHHIVRRVRARWRKTPTSVTDEANEIFYDALDEECEWFSHPTKPAMLFL